MGSDAAAKPVDVESVAQTAETFQCHELANNQRRSREALAEMRRATTALALALGSKQALVDALILSRTEPVCTNGRSLELCHGKRSFRTRRGDLYQKLWHLFHPGEELLRDFYSHLEKSADATITLDTMYTAAAASLTWPRCREAASSLRDSFNELAGRVTPSS